MNDRIRSLYQTVIIEKSKNTQFIGEIEALSLEMIAYNPLCGDKFKIHMKTKNGYVEAMRFTGSGCAISKASTVVLCELLEGCSIKDIESKIQQFLEIINEHSIQKPEEITVDNRLLAFAAARQFPERKTCANLAWLEVKSHLNEL